MNIDMNALGLTPAHIETASQEGLTPGRVAEQSHGLCRVFTAQGEIAAHVSGRYIYASPALPVAGDFVLLDAADGVIHRMLKRHSAFVRRFKQTEQTVAANIDTVFICMALDADYNLRRLERYIAIAWDSGAVPVVVLTKGDLCAAFEQKRVEAQAAAPGVDIIVSPQESGLLAGYMAGGRTVAFIGSSGVGKSTLINSLAGEPLAATGDMRRNGKGHHTTTSRSLMPLGGGSVIDTPGMREIGIEHADLTQSFPEIDALSKLCRFADCAHTGEPGCAVLEAVAQGEMPGERLDSWRKLQKEAVYAALNSRQIEAAKYESMLGPGGMKQIRRYVRERDRTE